MIGDDKHKHLFCKETIKNMKMKYVDYSFDVTVFFAENYFDMTQVIREERLNKIGTVVE